MNSTQWVSYFAGNRIGRFEPDWRLPYPEDASIARKLARSLSHFQLGESGEGRFLSRAAQQRYPDDIAYGEALSLFINEEKEHARLLAQLVERFGGSLIQQHWTHSLFRLLRRALGIRFELQVLVTAELIGTAYYRVLARRVRDVVTEQVCQLILADEARHVAFHLERFSTDQSFWLPFERTAWAMQFQALFCATLRVAWLDHGEALIAIGASAEEFRREARKEAVAFLAELSREQREAAATRSIPRAEALSAPFAGPPD